jgi:hypothetical protein
VLSQICIVRSVRVLGLVLLLAASTSYAAQQASLPKYIQANYVVSKDGTPFAKVTEQYVVTGNNYKVESTTKGIGIYALLGVRKLTSSGTVSAQGLKPIHFELHQGHNANKTLLADFNWQSNTLTMIVKGESQVVPITNGTQDLASFPYQFMFASKPFKNDITVKLTTGKKLNQYQYKIKPGFEALNIGGSQYKTIHLVPANLDKDTVETKELWLATEQSYVLARFLMVDEDGAKLEQVLTELHVR